MVAITATLHTRSPPVLVGGQSSRPYVFFNEISRSRLTGYTPVNAGQRYLRNSRDTALPPALRASAAEPTGLRHASEGENSDSAEEAAK